ncbi:MAG: T9SS type A sorting domain-containing protein [Flavobacteriales bacterium]|nr:T9SS type A sorting domain-containing protein [Flavobacteriales bacterium]
MMKRSLAFACMALAHSVNAQLFTAANVPITVSGGTEVTVEGGLQLNASSTITNQGELRVQGDWTNSSGGTGLTPTSNGNVRLYGGTQNIGGSSVTDFRRLILTGGNKQLLQDAVVGLPGQMDGTVQIGALLSLEGRTFTVFNPAANAVTHAGGWVASESLASRFQWALGNDVNEHRVLFGEPLGPAFPFAFTPTAAYPDGTLLSVATYRSAPDNTPYPITANQQVTNMAGAMVADNSPNTADRFWLVDLPNGSSTGTLLLSFAPAEDPQFGPGSCRAQRWLQSGTTWQYPPLPGQSNPAVREVLVPNVPFSETIAPANEHIWALAYDNSPLPIELIRFTAEPTPERHVRCSWTTAIELNNDYFTIERSRDGISFEAIGTLPGAGNSVVRRDYEWPDRTPFTGLSYYRLRQTDDDGSSSLSQVVPVWFDAQGPVIAVFPNPNNGTFIIARGDAEDELPFELLDASGRAVRQWLMPRGVERESITIAEASGLYMLRWNGGQMRVSIGR